MHGCPEAQAHVEMSWELFQGAITKTLFHVINHFAPKEEHPPTPIKLFKKNMPIIPYFTSMRMFNIRGMGVRIYRQSAAIPTREAEVRQLAGPRLDMPLESFEALVWTQKNRPSVGLGFSGFRV